MRTTNHLKFAFYCGACNEGFHSREEREEHKDAAHRTYYADLNQALSVPTEKRVAPRVRVSDAAPSRVHTGASERTTRQAPGSGGAGPSEKQQAFIAKLRQERGIDDTEMPRTKKSASALIDNLLAMPKAERTRSSHQGERKATVNLPDVPAGYYAIDTKPGATNTVGFYRVDRPTKGKWEGYTFVKRIIGGHPEERVPFRQSADILQRIIDAGVEQAGLRYGQEIGRCCACNRELTNDESRALGIGPECAKK